MGAMPVRYTVTAPNPANHRYHVRATLPAGCAELVFSSWSPGSYLMREFARHARDVYAHHAGAPVAVDRIERNRWRVATEGPYTLEYDVYAREKSVRTPFLDEDLGFFLPSNLLVHPLAPHAYELEVEVPAGHVGVCPLGPAVPGPAMARWTAADIDQLNDSPVATGPFEHTTFSVHGVEHHHWIEPGHNGDLARMNDDLRRIVETAAALVGDGLPYPRYEFVTLHVAKGHGGLEHKDGCVLIRPRNSFAQPKDYEEFVTLAAHEHFHSWNVKRIHPDTLGPRFDYSREHYTRDLWWLEDGTVYYEERIAFRSGLVARPRYYERLAKLIQKVEGIPGKRHQSLEDSSLDAWIKLYRQNEDSVNTGISYYLKGAVVMLAMDLELLHRTGGEHGVDSILRELWRRWGRHGVGYPERDALRDIAADLAGGGDWDRWWDAHIRGTEPVEIARALDHAGLDLVWGEEKPGSWLGLELSDRMVVESVREDGPCATALTPGDELIAIGRERVASGSVLADRLREIPVGTPVEILSSREGRLRRGAAVTARACPSDLKIVERTGMNQPRSRVHSAWIGLLPPRTNA